MDREHKKKGMHVRSPSERLNANQEIVARNSGDTILNSGINFVFVKEEINSTIYRFEGRTLRRLVLPIFFTVPPIPTFFIALIAGFISF